MTSNKPIVPFFRDDLINKKIEILRAVEEVLDSKHLILGAKVQEFEKAFAGFIGVGHCVGVGNGTDALEIALRAVGIKIGSSVATVSNAGFYTPTALFQIGAAPVFIEIDPITFLMSVEDLAEKINSHQVDAVVVTHLYGLPAKVAEIVKIAKQKNIAVIEDCAQAHGLKIGEKYAGTFGDAATFSFYPTKNLGAIGDGGAVVTNNFELNEKIRNLRQYGWKEKYQVAVPYGRNSRLDEIQAAVLLHKLKDLAAHNQLRIDGVKIYIEKLNQLPLSFSTLSEEGVAHLFPVIVENRKELKNFLTSQGIQTTIHYPIADHCQTAYKLEVSLPITEKFCDSVLSLPLYPGISEADVGYVASKIREFYGS